MFRTLLRRFVVIVLLIFVLTLGIGTGVVLDRQASAVQAAPSAATDSGPDFQLITEAWNKIQQNYVDQAAEQPKPLTYGAISGMVNALGDTGHTTFMSPEMVKSEQSYMQGAFEGIGAQVQSKDGHVVIVAPFDGSPAQKAGLRVGDAILKVNGNDMTGLALDQVVGQILGPAGTQVTVTVLKATTGQTLDLTLTRARITVNNVTWQKLPGTTIAHLRIAGFSQVISRDLRQALTDMQQQGVTGIILDLRNNPGGLLSEAIGTTSQFLSSGDVLLEKDAQDTITHVNVRPGGAATTIPMVVLINNGSASASEIVAGALQDAKRATLIGETTFGTGTVLQEFPLLDGSALMLAIQEWLTPNGRVIWHKGIAPDQTVTLSATANILTPESERDLTAAQLQASDDQQLVRGLAWFNRSAQGGAMPQTFSLETTLSAFAAIPTPSLALDLGLMQQFAFA